MDLIDDLKTESLYTCQGHQLDTIEHTLNIDDTFGDDIIFIHNNSIITDDSGIPYDKELSKNENRINRAQNLSWDEISELEDL